MGSITPLGAVRIPYLVAGLVIGYAGGHFAANNTAAGWIGIAIAFACGCALLWLGDSNLKSRYIER